MKILTVFGTRPECIKLAPVIKELERQGLPNKVCITAQHREMLDPFIEFFKICVDYDLAVMKSGQDLYHVTTKALLGLKDVLQKERPDVVIVQGDTTTAFAAALAAFYEKIRVAHVEAGLRTGCKYSPYPEEFNRRLVDHLSDWLYPPTEHARQNLLREGLSDEQMAVTGNTVVDALLMITHDARFREMEPPVALMDDHRMILVTAHRRESFGERFEAICHALREIADRNEDVEIVYPVHLNPNVRNPVRRILEGRERVRLLEPVGYLEFLKLMERAHLILTDSGGVQEEAPTLGKPVLVMRETTERPEGVEAGASQLVGTEKTTIVQQTMHLLADKQAYNKMVSKANPYGDGKASSRIVSSLLGDA